MTLRRRSAAARPAPALNRCAARCYCLGWECPCSCRFQPSSRKLANGPTRISLSAAHRVRVRVTARTGVTVARQGDSESSPGGRRRRVRVTGQGLRLFGETARPGPSLGSESSQGGSARASTTLTADEARKRRRRKHGLAGLRRPGGPQSDGIGGGGGGESARRRGRVRRR